MEVKVVESWDDFFLQRMFLFSQKDYYKIPLVFS